MLYNGFVKDKKLSNREKSTKTTKDGIRIRLWRSMRQEKSWTTVSHFISIMSKGKVNDKGCYVYVSFLTL